MEDEGGKSHGGPSGEIVFFLHHFLHPMLNLRGSRSYSVLKCHLQLYCRKAPLGQNPGYTEGLRGVGAAPLAADTGVAGEPPPARGARRAAGSHPPAHTCPGPPCARLGPGSAEFGRCRRGMQSQSKGFVFYLFLRLEKQEHVCFQGDVPPDGWRGKEELRRGAGGGTGFPVGAPLEKQEGKGWGGGLWGWRLCFH